MSRIVLVDGVPHERARDGELVPIQQHVQAVLGPFDPTQPCPEHQWPHRGSCPSCWAEIKAGDRPHSWLGRDYRAHRADPTPKDPTP